MKKYLILILFTIFFNFSFAQKCSKTKITILQLDTISANNNYACLTFYSSNALLKQIWWNKAEYPTRAFEIGKTYKLKLSKRTGILTIDDKGQVYFLNSCRAKDYYVDEIKHEDYEICN